MELTEEMCDRAYAAVAKDLIQTDDECLAATLAERERWLCAIRWCKEQYDVRVSQQSLTPWQVLDRLCIAFADGRGSYTEGGLPMS